MIWLTGCQFYTSMEIEYLPVYVPNEFEKLNPIAYARNMEAVVANALKIPVTNYCYENNLMWLNPCKRLGLPIETGYLD